MNTLLLDTAQWDLTIDLDGNIAMASNPYSLAQDAASAIRTFYGEVYYNTTLGVQYFGPILGQIPPLSLMKADFVAAALTVPEVTSAVAYLAAIKDRVATGQVHVFSANGVTSVAAFSTLPPPNLVIVGPSLDFSNPGNSQYMPGMP